MSIPEMIVAILTTGGLGVYLAKWLRYSLSRRKNSSKITEPKVGLSSIVALYDKLNELLNLCKADKVLIIEATNGGGKPNAGSSLHLTCLHEVIANKDVKILKPSIQNMVVTHGGITQLKSLLLNNFFIGHPDDLEDSFLRDRYIEEETTLMLTLPLFETNSGLVFMCVRFVNKEIFLTHSDDIVPLLVEYQKESKKILIESNPKLIRMLKNSLFHYKT